MKIKHYLGALLMAGSVVAISFPADANPGMRLCQKFCQLARPLAKSIGKTISKPGIMRTSGLSPRAEAQRIAKDLIKAKQRIDNTFSMPTPGKISQLPQLASPHPVVPTPVTGTEPDRPRRMFPYAKVAGVTLTASGGGVVVLNPQNSKNNKK
ncbi:hypothetical protein [Microcoleus vaginatus]|uniref:hypothetical protein n=1 Tax=Microcoleus vaginatus TaxID=119532 RepID=UPI0016888E23|nr:hypothetical protein [Microcoleus sp. FACHB-84]MBD2011681.1 hypothetical protein [Microcoleus sp. FACHB-45]